MTAPRPTYGSLKGNPRSMPCLHCLVAWPPLLQNMKGILILVLETTKEQQWEVIQLCVAITAAFPEIYVGKNEQPKTDGQWMQSHRWSVENIKDLHPDPSHQGLDTERSCSLKDPQNSSYHCRQGRQRGDSTSLCADLSPRGSPVCLIILHRHHLAFATDVA